MKDLKHYFADNSRVCETSKVEEVTRDGANDDNNASNDERIREISTAKKRGRVKIKISQTNSHGRVCDIVDTKSDLIDKTPSPFAPRDLKNDEFSCNDTPKRSNSLPRKITKNVNSNGIPSSSKSENEIKNSGDENDNLISNMAKFENIDSSMENVNSSKIEIERESNAFQVLMMKKKSIQYKIPAPMSQEDEELAVKIAEEGKLKLKQNKEKLIAIADKKGYTKRKINEIEEGEMIERRLEKRAKVFKQMCKKNGDGKNSPVLGKRVSPGSLHNYFSSKAIPENKEKVSTTVSSTVVVEAEVHLHNSLIPIKVKEMREKKILTKANDEKIKESLAKMDVIEVAMSPVKEPVVNEESQAAQRRNKKPRWSLRINLQGNDRENKNDPVVENGDKISRGKRESKPKQSKGKTMNCEMNESSDESSVRSSKKKKLSSNGKNGNGSSKMEIRSLEKQKEMLPLIVATVEEKNIVKIDEPEIIEVKIINRPPEKLAPLFVKRQKPDPAVLEARRAFLHSMPEENLNRKDDRKAPILGSPLLPFPTISHVTQLDHEPKIDNLPFKSIFPTRQILSYVPSFDPREFRSITNLEKEESKKSNDSIEITKSDVDQILNEIETRCPDARELWTRISSKLAKPEKSGKSPKRRGKKRKSAEKKIETSSNEKSNENFTWTQKYRPTRTQDIVGNEEAAEKFRKWLNGWKVNSRQEENNSSGDEFYSSDCSYSSNVDNNQVAVLLGPHGSGKTATVYAIAEELGYSVLEVNASSRRAGKKILKELEEATKSHRIKKPDILSLKPITSDSEKIVPQNSLILVEDVDLIFEEDEGFISATCQLASNTKRPIVMTGRDTCAHLNRMAPQQLRIYYQSTVGSRVAALLELITLAESDCGLPRPCLDLLLKTGDLRKALLQLQYLLLSGKPSVSAIPTNFHQSLWQDMRQCLYKPAIRATKKSTKKKPLNNEKLSSKKGNTIIDNLAKDLENLSFLSTLVEIDDPALEFSSLKLEPSLSLDENVYDYSSVHGTSFEIAKWLRDNSMNSRETTDCGNDLQNLRQISLKRELNVGVNLALSQVSPHNLDHRSTQLDYLSSVRTICRAEEARNSKNTKRGNRFFHYLQNLRLPSLSTRSNILAAACKIMHEKNSES